jgi:AcrR family transcriptional regulator
MNSTDLRVRRTRKTLRQGLFELLQKHEFDKISVIDICRESMVTRATFYTHYKDKYDLLEDGIRTILFEPLEKYRTEKHEIENIDEMLSICEEVIHIIDSRRSSFAYILRRNEYVEYFIRKYLASVLVNIISSREHVPVPREIYAEYYSNACVSVVSAWIKDNMNYTANEIVEYLKTLLNRGAHAV